MTGACAYLTERGWGCRNLCLRYSCGFGI